MNKIFTSTLFLCMAFLFLFTACSKQERDKNVVLVGTNAEFPPFSYMEDGKIVGFDIDVAKEVVKRMDKEIQFKNMPFDALITEVILGHVDFVAAGLSYTPERAERVLFTKSYIQEDPLVIVTLSDKFSKEITLDDLLGKIIVVNEGFTADILMSSKKGYDLVRLPIVADGFLALKNGRADAFITAESTVASFTNTQDVSKFHVSPIEGTGETCALIISKENPKLLLEIQSLLDQMEADGTLAKLKSKWKLK